MSTTGMQHTRQSIQQKQVPFKNVFFIRTTTTTISLSITCTDPLIDGTGINGNLTPSTIATIPYNKGISETIALILQLYQIKSNLSHYNLTDQSVSLY